MTVNGNHSAPAAANRMNRPPAGGLKVVLEDVRQRGGSGENQGWNDEPPWTKQAPRAALPGQDAGWLRPTPAQTPELVGIFNPTTHEGRRTRN
jgi:hypothetical protein